MKKVVYIILACIIIIGTVITTTMGLKADLIYSKNAEIDIYIGKQVNKEEINDIVKEVFSEKKVIVQQIELFGDMVSITIPEKSDEELKTQIEQLNTKINEKYGTENKAEDIKVIHNSKIKLSSIIKPYIVPIAISALVILVYVIVRYRKLGILKTIVSYILTVGAVEAVFLSIIAITRFPINRLVIPIGLLLYITTITILEFLNENKLLKIIEAEKTKNK